MTEDAGTWIMVHSQPPMIVRIPFAVLAKGPNPVTIFLMQLGYPVETDQDWDIMMQVPESLP
jgi:hypothetical protein